MNRKLILASSSPRRKELMEEAGFAFEIHSEPVEEIFHHELGRNEAIMKIACDKAEASARRYPDAVVIGADTMVCYENDILGKPADRDDAIRMLSMLSGHTHEVITGVAIICREKTITFHAVTRVTFYDLDDDMISDYVDSKEPFDKAGSYGIQGTGRLLVEKIDGDYFNVVGLPIARVYRELKKLQETFK